MYQLTVHKNTKLLTQSMKQVKVTLHTQKYASDKNFYCSLLATEIPSGVHHTMTCTPKYVQIHPWYK